MKDIIENQGQDLPQMASNHTNALFGHGNIQDAAIVLKDDSDILQMMIEMLPITANKMEEISGANEMTKRTFFSLVRQSFSYVDTIRELAEEIKENGRGTTEEKEKNEARTRCHNATISTVDIWVRSLAKSGVNVGFMSEIVKEPKNRVVYGNFAVGLALSIYTDRNFDIQKYTIDKVL